MTCRQHPDTKTDVVFVTIEDESGNGNIAGQKRALRLNQGSGHPLFGGSRQKRVHSRLSLCEYTLPTTRSSRTN